MEFMFPGGKASSFTISSATPIGVSLLVSKLKATSYSDPSGKRIFNFIGIVPKFTFWWSPWCS